MKLAVGLGCDRGAILPTLETVLDSALSLIDATRDNIVLFATIDKKNDEACMLQLAENLRVPLHFFTAEQLAAVTVPNPSETVRKYMGTPAVSEAAAILVAQTDASQLLVEKHKHLGTDGKNATVSIVKIPT